MYPIDVDQSSSSLVQNLWAGYEESENISDFSMQDGEISCRYVFLKKNQKIYVQVILPNWDLRSC
jgi:hypothetical protein